MKTIAIATPIWIIKDNNTGMYFSMLGSNHFTSKVEAAQMFGSEKDAILCEEQNIHCEVDFLETDTIPVVLSSTFLDSIVDKSNHCYDAMEQIVSESALVEEVEANIQSMIYELELVKCRIKKLKLDGETRLE